MGRPLSRTVACHKSCCHNTESMKNRARRKDRLRPIDAIFAVMVDERNAHRASTQFVMLDDGTAAGGPQGGVTDQCTNRATVTRMHALCWSCARSAHYRSARRAETPEDRQACTPTSTRIAGNSSPTATRSLQCLKRKMKTISPACRDRHDQAGQTLGRREELSPTRPRGRRRRRHIYVLSPDTAAAR